ncbi:ADP-ribose pyrophosphatase [Secundilactobacillus pentosiphilus]|uniref:ADP-ribose pyrophosphatase n=1 Tax=Secundilactobacillus pentosiphilus TaxID=1714682 RepID=A0A1Z5IPH4_9LACO|nr:NUDIX hydrolase [Secundilactobacillus pentosiphilus]GAX03596.1 ADP-ribose pyrophosphatase [Secundilactobacillus pentosiphilus]GAX05567.1 ADP-ribose pyrophosphatase [Secundilactobacillus pentosiphilus]
MDLEEKVVAHEDIYDGAIINVERQTVELPNGEKAHREIVHHSGAVAIMAITAENKMILVRQWRSPIGRTTLEIPAGKLDSRDGDDPKHAAVRELNEEIRLHPSHLERLTGFYSSVGFSDEYMTLYLATDLQPVQSELPRDKGENLNIRAYSLDELKTMVANGEIEDAKTVMAVWRFELIAMKK